MSVIVKGMKMPDNCTECNLMTNGWCYCFDPPETQPGLVDVEGHRPGWCPLCPLPKKHGDLVDTDVRPVIRCRDCFANGACSVQDVLFDNDLDKAADFFCANGKSAEVN